MPNPRQKVHQEINHNTWQMIVLVNVCNNGYESTQIIHVTINEN